MRTDNGCEGASDAMLGVRSYRRMVLRRNIQGVGRVKYLKSYPLPWDAPKSAEAWELRKKQTVNQFIQSVEHVLIDHRANAAWAYSMARLSYTEEPQTERAS